MPTTITYNRVASLIKKGAQIIDIRSPVDYLNNPTPNSINLPLRRLTEITKFARSTSIILCGDSDSIPAAVNYVEQFGFVNVYVLKPTP